jgi:hypothetical protein
MYGKALIIIIGDLYAMKRLTLAGLFVLETLSALSTSNAWAVDLTKPVKTIDGDDFTDQSGRPLPLTLSKVIEGALFNEPTTGDDAKGKNYWLAVEVHNHASDFKPTPDQIIQIRKALAATQTTAIFGQIMVVLDPTWMPSSGK